MHEVTQLLGQKALVMEQLREEKEKARLAAQELEAVDNERAVALA